MTKSVITHSSRLFDVIM